MNRIAVINELKRIAQTLEGSTSLNGMSKIKALKTVNEVLRTHTHGMFHDENWHPVHETFRLLDQIGVNYVLVNTKYDQDSRGNPKTKTWKLEFPFVDDKGKEKVLYGQIIADGCGPISDVLSSYDLVAYAN